MLLRSGRICDPFFLRLIIFGKFPFLKVKAASFREKVYN
jgi:hypothetical protein